MRSQPLLKDVDLYFSVRRVLQREQRQLSSLYRALGTRLASRIGGGSQNVRLNVKLVEERTKDSGSTTDSRVFLLRGNLFFIANKNARSRSI